MKNTAALIVVDMLKDYFDPVHPLPITGPAKSIIGPINQLIREFRRYGLPIIFSTDAFEEHDFLFKSRLKPHAIRGTEGAKPIDELERLPGDLWLPKPRFSAFFKTTLADHLREEQVGLCAIAGIATNFCVLTTALDALQHGFETVILRDCTAAADPVVHEKTLSLYENTVLYPLLRVMDSHELILSLKEMAGECLAKQKA